MSPRKRRSGVLDADPGEALSVEDAEAAAAEAEARAEQARIRAEELRRQARRRAWSRPQWLRLPPARLIAVGAAIVLICAALAATGYMMWDHRGVVQERQRTAEFSAAARQSVVTMMTIDPAKAREGVQRIIDNSTGSLKADLESTADAMISSMETSKVATKVNVVSVAVESVTNDSAVVLVAAVSDVTDPNAAKRPPVTWRISVTMKRDSGQLKMSRFEFV
jgi:Mce-associated membrane protein